MKKVLLLLTSLFALLQALAGDHWFDPLTYGTGIVHGRTLPVEENNYYRFPQSLESLLPDYIWSLSRCSAGLYLEFSTSAKEFSVSYTFEKGAGRPHIAPLGVSGVDGYVEEPGRRWAKLYLKRYKFTGDSALFTFRDTLHTQSVHRFRLYLPPYNVIKRLAMSADGAQVDFHPSTQQPAVLIYGSSILQGACASRAGMVWSSILSRQLTTPVVNLGFSGRGLLDSEVVEAMTRSHAACFVFDCVPNLRLSPPDTLYTRVLRAVEMTRRKSQSPILLVEFYKGGRNFPDSTASAKNNEQYRAYRELLRRGVKRLYYLSADELNLHPEGLTDHIHPSDLGMMDYATAVRARLKKIGIK